MAGFWVFFCIFCTIYAVQTLKRIPQSPVEIQVYQPDKVLCVNICDSATLHCCVSGSDVGVIFWYKQPIGKQPGIISRVHKSEVVFYNQFINDRFQVTRSSHCSNMTISNIIQSDEAMYYCAVILPYSVFGGGTYLKIQGEHLTNTSETSTPALWDNSVVCEPTLRGNCTNMSTQETTVLILGTALGSCALLIVCLTYFILKGSECFKMKPSVEHSSVLRQETEAKNLSYAALQFSKRNPKPDSSSTEVIYNNRRDECVYSSVKKN